MRKAHPDDFLPDKEYLPDEKTLKLMDIAKYGNPSLEKIAKDIKKIEKAMRLQEKVHRKKSQQLTKLLESCGKPGRTPVKKKPASKKKTHTRFPKSGKTTGKRAQAHRTLKQKDYYTPPKPERCAWTKCYKTANPQNRMHVAGPHFLSYCDKHFEFAKTSLRNPTSNPQSGWWKG